MPTFYNLLMLLSLDRDLLATIIIAISINTIEYMYICVSLHYRMEPGVIRLYIYADNCSMHIDTLLTSI